MSLPLSYARALYEAAKDTGGATTEMDQLEEQLDSFSMMLETHRDLHKILLGPIASLKEKTAIIEEIAKRAGFPVLLRHFVLLLIAKDRLSFFYKIREAFSTVRLAAEGGVSGRLVSSEPLTDLDIQGLAAAFSKKLAKKVAFLVSTDASLLAGMKVTVNGVTYDGSLKTQLQQLRDSVMTGYAPR
ncbi:ATP synthase F1 subunit delta [Bdellovibrionota bacterium FG-1]